MIRFANYIAVLLSSAASAQEVPPTAQDTLASPTGSSAVDRNSVYEAGFFTGFAPVSALDMVRQVPGFVLEEGNADVRGFAGAAGNVVINGARPSSKSSTIATILTRIPAGRVLRIEVGPGDLYGAEYSGRSQVLNVVLTADGGTSGNVSVSTRRVYTGRLRPNVEGSIVLQRGASMVTLSGASDYKYIASEGTDELTDLATSDLIEFRRKFLRYNDGDGYLAGSWAMEQGPDKAIRLNARWEPSVFKLEQDNRVAPAIGPAHDDGLIQHNREPAYELGGDVTWPLAGGAIKLVGLATRQEKDNFSTVVRRNGLLSDGAQVVGGFEQMESARFDERIGRVSWSHKDIPGFAFEAGGEAVLNTLDSLVELFLIDANGGREQIDLPIDSATVKEARGEVFVNAGRSLGPGLRIDAGLNYEFSRLRVRGDAIADRSLQFLKPTATLDWRPGNDWHAQLSIRRNVAQLDFFDFISAAELSTDRVNAGNRDLVPQRAWEFRLSLDRPILKEGLAKLDLGHDMVSLLQDRVLVFNEQGEAFDAPGNIGTGRRYFAKLLLDAPLGNLWSGLRAKFSGQVQRTRVEDPISGEMRNFSGFFRDWEWEVDLRRDAGALSYGLTVADEDRFTFFRTDEFDSTFNSGPFGKAFIEYRPDARTSLVFDVDNLFATANRRERVISSPDRSAPVSVARELRHRNSYLTMGLTLKRSFGGASLIQ